MRLVHRSRRAATAVRSVSTGGELFVASVVVCMLLAAFGDAVDPTWLAESGLGEAGLEFALFDFELHARPPEGVDVQALLDGVRAEVAVVRPPAWNRFQNGFTHIFGGGYAAGYYSYKWAEVLSADAYAAFEETQSPEGVHSVQTGRRFRECILEAGGSRPAMASFKAFRGREPSLDALMRHQGMATSA